MNVAFNMDCLVGIANAPDIAFDLVLTDPPYGVLDEKWDDLSSQEFSAFTMRWLGRVRRFNCPLITFGGQKTSNEFTTLLRLLYDNVRQIIWDKGSGGVAVGGFFHTYEAIYFCYPDDSFEVVKPKNNVVGELIKKYRERKGITRSGVDIQVRGKKTGLCFRWEEGACLPTPEQSDALKRVLDLNGELEDALAVAYTDRDKTKQLLLAESTKRAALSQDVLRFASTSETDHLCEKPVALLRHLMKCVSRGEKLRVLDPFLGSGSSRIAAYDLGFDFTGYELDKDYFDAQEKRFQTHIAQARLFEPVQTVEQENLFT